MNSLIELSYWDIGYALLMVALLAIMLSYYRLGITRSLGVACVRLVAQLMLIGYVLRYIFDEGELLYVGLMAIVMLLAASREIMARQKRRLRGITAWGIGVTTLFISSFAVALYGIFIVVQPDPWYLPQYTIPLLGMIMSNTMSAISLGMDRLTSAIYDQRAIVEQRLALGQTAREAVRPFVLDCIRTGMTPVINSMATAGIVALPGMMTGQILAGASPLEAVKYQIMIWLFIASGAGFGMIVSLRLLEKTLFDHRQRLRLERLK